MQLNITYWP